LAFAAVLASRLLLPQLAFIYNNQGFAALGAGDLTEARQKFQRAVALDPDLEVPYHNLADIYHRIGRPDEAETWYQKAIERDLNYALAYRGLGHLYNTRGEHEQAETVLLAGLFYLDETAGREPEREKEETVARYALLSDLGWAYFAQGRYTRAQEALEAAVALEDQLRSFEEEKGVQYRLPLPHYYLAQVYEQLERPRDAYREWEDCLRLLRPGWEYKEWRAMVVEHIEELEKELQ
jgi:tetratricopeptide (TPR) repeat protein